MAEETPLFSTIDLYDPSIFSDFPPFTDPEDLDGTLQTDLTTDPSFLFPNDNENGPLSIFANSNGGCPSETSQLTSPLSRRGGAVDACENPGGNSGLNAPSINPKVAPFIDIETMEVKSICPSRNKSPYSVPVCSSGIKGDIVTDPPDANFYLFRAQRSKALRV